MTFQSGQGPLQGQAALGSWLTLYFRLFGAFLCGLLCFAGCHVLFRFSPTSVRMLLATLTYCLWSNIKIPNPTSSNSELVFLGSIIAAYVGYRLAVKYCCAYLF